MTNNTNRNSTHRRHSKKIYNEGERNRERLTFKYVTEEEVERIVDNCVEYLDNQRFDESQFSKYFGHIAVKWFGVFQYGTCLALSALIENYDGSKFTYIAEIQSLVKGYGKKLLWNILENRDNVWFCADVKGGRKLLSFYNQFGMKRKILKASALGNGKRQTFYYSFSTTENEKWVENKIKEFEQ